jgi:hypothetical protein
VHPWCTVYKDTFPEILISHKEKQTGMGRRNKQIQEQMKREGNKEVKGEASGNKHTRERRILGRKNDR